MTAYVGPPLGDVRKAMEESSERLVALLRQVRDRALPAVGEWNVGETAAHLAASATYFHGVAKGIAEPTAMADVAKHNAELLAEDWERDPVVLADRFEDGERLLIETFGHLTEDPIVEPFKGCEVPMSAVFGVELGEILVHGWDIARACDLPWTIEPHHAAVALGSLIHVLPATVDAKGAAGFSAAFEMRIRGDGVVLVVFDQGSAHLEDPSDRAVDFRMSVDPVAYLLLLFRRIPQWKPIIQGKLRVWGRRPWLATTLMNKFMVI